VSSAILYIAIIAIWAIFLVPAWLRRPHGQQAGETDAYEHAESDVAVEYTEHVTDTESDVEISAEADLHDEVNRYEHGRGQAGRPQRTSHATSDSRQQMLRARRRILSILIAITLVTIAFTYLGLIKWWLVVPPTAMLLLYMLLLREIAVADAELARKRAKWEAAEARAYDRYLQDQEQAESEAYEASASDSGAEIIDISGRVGDQLYDQYADAAVRAVGD